MPRILKLAGKHGDEFFDADNEEQLGKAALVILEERLDEGWYEEEWAKTAAGIVEMRVHDEDLAGDKAWKFLQLRKDYEYEGVYLENTR